MIKDKMFSQLPVFVRVILIVAFVFTMLFWVLYTPVDYIRYRLSHRRKLMRRLYGKQAKYTWLVSVTEHFKIYELVAKHGLPLTFYKEGENPCSFGFFYCDRILFLTEHPQFDEETDRWFIVSEQEHDECDLNTYIESAKNEFYQCIEENKRPQCDRVVFLVNEKDIDEEEKEYLDNADFVLTYNKKNFADKINGLLAQYKTE